MLIFQGVAPEKRWLEDEAFLFGTVNFLMAMLNFHGVMLSQEYGFFGAKWALASYK